MGSLILGHGSVDSMAVLVGCSNVRFSSGAYHPTIIRAPGSLSDTKKQSC
jgi:hypothetical protein